MRTVKEASDFPTIFVESGKISFDNLLINAMTGLIKVTEILKKHKETEMEVKRGSLDPLQSLFLNPCG